MRKGDRLERRGGKIISGKIYQARKQRDEALKDLAMVLDRLQDIDLLVKMANKHKRMPPSKWIRRTHEAHPQEV